MSPGVKGPEGWLSSGLGWQMAPAAAPVPPAPLVCLHSRSLSSGVPLPAQFSVPSSLAVASSLLPSPLDKTVFRVIIPAQNLESTRQPVRLSAPPPLPPVVSSFGLHAAALHTFPPPSPLPACCLNSPPLHTCSISCIPLGQSPLSTALSLQVSHLQCHLHEYVPQAGQVQYSQVHLHVFLYQNPHHAALLRCPYLMSSSIPDPSSSVLYPPPQLLPMGPFIPVLPPWPGLVPSLQK